MIILWCSIAACLGGFGQASAATVQQQAQAFLTWYNSTAEVELYKDVVGQWNYYTNTTKYNENLMSTADAVYSVFAQQQAANASQYDISQISDLRAQRLLKMIKTVGIKLSKNDTKQLSSLSAGMINIYSNTKICGFTNGSQDCSKHWLLDPDIFELLANTTDYDLLQYLWTQWRNATAGMKPTYKQFVDLSNKGARAGGFKDTGDWWRSWYETDNFEQQVLDLFHQVLPLYEQLHTFIRRQLRDIYPGKLPNHTIPAHLLGNMWAQEWQNIFPLVQPFKNVSSIDVTQAMVQEGYTPNKMFHTADYFFRSLQLIPMPQPFWDKTIMVKPDRGFVCHASAWDFYNRKDFRIKMCTKVNMNDLVTIHHEMGHIQYYLQYANQPVSFRNGANPGFHEGIGDTLALSVATPQHLQAIGLLKNYVSNDQQDINYLLSQAMSKVAFLPWGYLMDKWRWEVFDGSLPYDQWNKGWWDLRYKLQGLSPPVNRPPNAFDPAAKSHIDDNTPYIRYFVSFIVQFQFYESMCQAANHTGPLYKCDFYKNAAAGTRLANMLSMGSSEKWPQAMQRLTGQPNMDAGAIKRYFDPLTKWLQQQNQAAGDCYGWGYEWPKDVLCSLLQPRCGIPNPDCTPPPPTTHKPSAASQPHSPDTLLLLTLTALTCVAKSINM